ncbi:sugar ABC transporter substrate-binding protein [Treponema primitia]|uniref:sugar ABC transporter substrate-binding protein n=1 Tax=Treponema primitia TaxID=88058 RepID=UPI0002554E0E|nr:substrate-binding domain-containing protein [Treponema primitia]
MKKLFILGVVLAVFASANIFAGGAKDTQPLVVWVNPLIGSTVFTAADNGLGAAAKEYGFRLKITGRSVIDVAGYNQSIQDAIIEKPIAIAICPYAYEAFAPTLADARAKGIKIININMDSPENTRSAYVGTDNAVYGKLAADYIAKQKNGKANVLIMQAGLTFPNQVEQRDAFVAACAEKYPDVKIVLNDEDQADSAIAVQKFKDIFRANPTIDTVLCLDSIAGVAAGIATKEMDTVGKITILAIDDNEDTLQYIQDGVIWGTMAQNFYKAGRIAGELAVKAARGDKVPSAVDAGTVLITKENITTYSEEFYK